MKICHYREISDDAELVTFSKDTAEYLYFWFDKVLKTIITFEYCIHDMNTFDNIRYKISK
jgi:hypothetical protein